MPLARQITAPGAAAATADWAAAVLVTVCVQARMFLRWGPAGPAGGLAPGVGAGAGACAATPIVNLAVLGTLRLPLRSMATIVAR